MSSSIYEEAPWRPLINACRQPSLYRSGGLLAGNHDPASLPAAGEGARWFMLPCGAVLLAPSCEGRWAWLADLQQAPLHLGPFVLSYRPTMNPATERRRERVRAVRAARREAGHRSPDPPPLPNAGRLVLAVSGSWLKAQRRELEAFALSMARPAFRREAPQLVASVNARTAAMSQVARFAWVDPSSLRGWNSSARGAVVGALVRQGMKPDAASRYADQYLRVWRLRSEAKKKHVGKGPGGRAPKERRPGQTPAQPVSPAKKNRLKARRATRAGG